MADTGEDREIKQRVNAKEAEKVLDPKKYGQQRIGPANSVAQGKSGQVRRVDSRAVLTDSVGLALTPQS